MSGADYSQGHYPLLSLPFAMLVFSLNMFVLAYFSMPLAMILKSGVIIE